MFKTGAHHAERAQKSWNTRYAGKEAFTANKADGYRCGLIFARAYRAHRVIFAMQTGAWPVEEIDHINHQRADNRWSNIRTVKHAENHKNKSLDLRNTSGFCGVFWNKATGKWRARITIYGQQLYLGYFVDKVDAVEAREAANKKYGVQENHGRKIAA